ncbi:MAG: glycerophosphodiester phosphodiesterase [Candidatus Dormibacteraeota bacterium]|nr:glycerophosphodiester phosphodiesterase [Candidatus Dormibacteraeota bacterium]
MLLPDRPAPLVIAHRGASSTHPENTLAAFEAAIVAGADCVELDVRRTADGRLVVHHPAQRRGVPLARLSYPELVRRSRHRPPLLEEVAELCAGRIALDVEIKEPGSELDAAEVVLQRFPPAALLFTSFHEPVITSLSSRFSDLRCGLLAGPARARLHSRRPVKLDEAARRSGAVFLALHQRVLGRLPASPGWPVAVWTVNSPARLARYLSDPRVFAIITDVPRLALQMRQTAGQRS